MSVSKYNNTSDIMDYLENELDNAKRTAFEQQMQEDPELSAEVEVHKKLREQLSEEAALYNIVNKAYEKHKENQNPLKVVKQEEQLPKPSSIRKLLPRIAAAAAVLIPLFFVINNLFTTYTSQQVLAQNFSTSVEAPKTRGSLTDAYNTYNEGDYEKAITYFEKTEKKEPMDELLMGISYAKIKQYDKALNQLIPLSKKTKDYPTQAIEAQWEIIGIYLAQGNTEQALANAKEYTKNVPKENQHENTKRLLRQLKKIKK